MTFLCSLRFTV